jgi:hypothetical protein
VSNFPSSHNATPAALAEIALNAATSTVYRLTWFGAQNAHYFMYII